MIRGLIFTLIIMVSLSLGFVIGSNLDILNSYLEHPEDQPGTIELASPYDHVPEDDIILTENGLFVIDLHDREISWSSYSDTNSMDPLLDVGCNGLEFVPESTEDIHVGDIIAYEDNGLVVHRVIEIGEDDEGWYVITKGDNNPFPDKKQRYDDVKYITFGFIC